MFSAKALLLFLFISGEGSVMSLALNDVHTIGRFGCIFICMPLSICLLLLLPSYIVHSYIVHPPSYNQTVNTVGLSMVCILQSL